ncbi:MAG: aryl-sulfate sulfotransferase [Desulfovibrionaceae bacterium]|nr:aryl-sulfate sulfotransferase [Desulfovibrionaceae bacterium]
MKRMWKGAAAALALSFVCSAPAAAYEAFSGPLGLLYSDKSKAFDGYTLVAPLQTNVTYLMDMDGNIINEWTCDTTPFYSELLPNGNLIRHGRLPDAWPAYGGVSGVLQEYDWSGNKVWEYKMFTPGVEVSHHTFEVMPNGNYMLLGWEHKSYDEMVKAGRDVNLPGHSVFKDGMKIDGRMVEGIWPDFVREINRQGETVWEWHVWDHLGKGPDKIDINVFLTPKRSPVTAGPDWTHFNGVSYNPNTDQVALTSRNLGEVYIIDKKTGNIVSRWGNPANYGEGKFPSGYYDDGDTELFGPHAPDWTSDTTVSIFDNGDARLSANYSRAVEVDVTTGKIVWQWRPADVGTTPSNFYTATQGGCQKLPNGNWLITSTNTGGHTIEVTPDKEIVWEFINPLGRGNKVYATSGKHGQTGQFMVHKSLRYAKDDPRFAGKDMSVKRKLMPEGTPNWVELLQFQSAPSELPKKR